MSKPPEFSRFDRDPEALAWARSKAQAYIDTLAKAEQQANAKEDPFTSYGCAVARRLAERYFLGDGGCTVGAFDPRMPDLANAIDKAPATDVTVTVTSTPHDANDDIDCNGDQALWNIARQHDIPTDQTIQAGQHRWWIANAIKVATQIEERAAE